MKKKLFLFVTSEGVTYSTFEKLYPDVDNLQILGYGEGRDEKEALENFICNNKWVLDTEFQEVICIEIKSKIAQGKRFILNDSYGKH